MTERDLENILSDPKFPNKYYLPDLLTAMSEADRLRLLPLIASANNARAPLGVYGTSPEDLDRQLRERHQHKDATDDKVRQFLAEYLREHPELVNLIVKP